MLSNFRIKLPFIPYTGNSDLPALKNLKDTLKHMHFKVHCLYCDSFSNKHASPLCMAFGFET